MKFGLQGDTPLLLALAVWPCTLPIRGLPAVFFGGGIGLTTVAVLLVIILTLCCLLCLGVFWRATQLNDTEETRR